MEMTLAALMRVVKVRTCHEDGGNWDSELGRGGWGGGGRDEEDGMGDGVGFAVEMTLAARMRVVKVHTCYENGEAGVGNWEGEDGEVGMGWGMV